MFIVHDDNSSYSCTTRVTWIKFLNHRARDLKSFDYDLGTCLYWFLSYLNKFNQFASVFQTRLTSFELENIKKQDYVRSIKCASQTFTILARKLLRKRKAFWLLSRQNTNWVSTDNLNKECQQRITDECRKHTKSRNKVISTDIFNTHNGSFIVFSTALKCKQL